MLGGASAKIAVAFVGDARDLRNASRDAEKSVSGFGKNAGKGAGAVGALFAVDQVFAFGDAALAESDRIGDAISRLTGQLGTELTGAVDAVADDFTHLGQSRQDILELAAGFADMATALGIGAPDIAAWADDVAAIAAALELQGIGDAATNVDLIGKAAGGSERALRDLGINLDEAAVQARALHDSGKDNPELLTDSEIAAARLAEVMDTLKTRTGDLNAANGDLEQSQAEVQAKWETLTGKFGEAIEGPLNDLLGWIISGIEGWELFAENLDLVRSELRKTLGPIYAVTDALAALVALWEDARDSGALSGRTPSGRPLSGTDRGTSGPGSDTRSPSQRSGDVIVNVNGGDPAQVEREVDNALRRNSWRTGASYPIS